MTSPTLLPAKGEYLPLASPGDDTAYDYSPDDKARIAQDRARLSVGKPEKALAKLEPLIESNKTDELMVTAMIFNHVACTHSYELLAKVLT